MDLLFSPAVQEEPCHKEVTPPLFCATSSGRERTCAEGPGSQLIYPTLSISDIFSGI